ncbi:MAG: B12-binding domain-containing radical SAM protein [Thermodesulfobacteriota bacterium]
MKKFLYLIPPVAGGTKNVVRDFVYGCWCNGKRIGGMQMPPLNMLYAVSHCRAAGVEAELLDGMMEPEKHQAMVEEGFRDLAGLVLLSSTQSFRDDVALCRQVKAANPAVKTILFGSHPTFMPQFCLQEPDLDYIVLREPEETLRRLCLALQEGRDPADLPGIGRRGADGQAVINPPRPFLDMDELTPPDRSLLPKDADYFNPVVKRLPYTTMQTSRGCPGRCIFCTAPTFYGRRYRVRSVANILAELRQVKAQGFREVFFRDETFSAMKKRNLDLCQAMLDEKLDLSWIANARVDMIDEDAMRLMKKAGCHMLKFGVETGSDRILANYKKGTTTAQARRAFALAKAVGLDTHAHLVLGGPGETAETIADTLRFVKDLDPSTASFGILTPYPGTELFDMVAEKHPEIKDGTSSNMENLHVQGFYSEAICGMNSRELERAIVKAYRSFYWRPSYLAKRLTRIRSLEELMVLLLAGLSVFSFSLTGEK